MINSHDPQNLQHVKLDLPRQQRIVNSRRPWVGENPNYVPPVAQQWNAPAQYQAAPRQISIKVPVRRIMLGIGLVFGALLMLGLGAMMGSQQPDLTTQATLHYAQSHAPAGQRCGAVWLDGSDHWTVECGQIGQ